MSELEQNTPTDAPREAPLLGVSPAVLGTILCGLSAVLYAAAAICIRRLADMPCDDALKICVKETVTVAVVGPWLVVQSLRGRKLLPSFRMLALLVGVALLVQIVGNLNQIYAFGWVGLTIAVPVTVSMMMIAGATFGRLLLGEHVSSRSIGAIVLLVVSIATMSLAGRGEAKPSPEDGLQAEATIEWTPRQATAGVLAAAVAGVTFASLAVALRYAGQQGVYLPLVMVITTATGTVALSIIGHLRGGLGQLLDASPELWAWMLAAGVFNLTAFAAITTGLSMTKVARANILSASQVALTTVAGVFFFHESWTPLLIIGISLTIFGIILISPPDEDEAKVPL